MEKLETLAVYLGFLMIGALVWASLVMYGIEDFWVLATISISTVWMLGAVITWFILCLHDRAVDGRWSILRDLYAKAWTSGFWFITFPQLDLEVRNQEMNEAGQ